jgi:coproporphyrinogen III oxidase-like Fe-S oxidoreductase
MLESGIYPKEWKSLSPSDEDIANEYMDVVCVLKKAGYHHYEVSNWAKP